MMEKKIKKFFFRWDVLTVIAVFILLIVIFYTTFFTPNYYLQNSPVQFDIKRGEQVIEFTPTQEGTVRWSCWMGMIPGTFVVKDDIDLGNEEAVQKELDAVPEQPRGSCGAARGGSCGCGGR